LPSSPETYLRTLVALTISVFGVTGCTFFGNPSGEPTKTTTLANPQSAVAATFEGQLLAPADALGGSSGYRTQDLILVPLSPFQRATVVPVPQSFVCPYESLPESQKTPAVKQAITEYSWLALAACMLVASGSSDASGNFKISVKEAPPGPILDPNPVALLQKIGFAKLGYMYRYRADASQYLVDALAYAKGYPQFKDFPTQIARIIATSGPMRIVGTTSPSTQGKYQTASSGNTPEGLTLVTLADGKARVEVTPATTCTAATLSGSYLDDLGSFNQLSTLVSKTMTPAQALAATQGQDWTSGAAVFKDVSTANPDLASLMSNLASTFKPIPAPSLPADLPRAPLDVLIEPTGTLELNMPGTGAGTDLRPSALDLAATVLMSDGSTSHEVTWQTSDEHIVQVDSSGHASAVGAGKATLTAVTLDGVARASVSIEVRSGGQVMVEVQ